MAVRWLSSMAIGVDEVDDQHKELFRMVNNLLDACEKGTGKDNVAEIVKFLEKYVVVHFSTEEKLMQEYGYPQYPEHKQKHTDFISDFLGFKKSFVDEGVTTKFLADFNRLVVDWLIKHIAEVDKLMGEYLETKM